MKLLAISGGPDSMFLLDWYKKKKIVVAHVNYNKRDDSDNDETIVRDFCVKHKIPFKSLNIKEVPTGNFQSWAREVRYTFFREVFNEFKCSELITAHHRDDFLETAIMQQESGRTPRFFGIRKNNFVHGMKVYRPLINLYWKDEILNYLAKNNIRFAIDSSNSQPIFERNIIRIRLAKKSLTEKKSMFKWFVMSNKILKKKFWRVDYLYRKWKKSNFNVNLFRSIKHKEEVIYEYINDNFLSIKLSTGKISSLVDFIISKNGGKDFILNKNISITKNMGSIQRK